MNESSHLTFIQRQAAPIRLRILSMWLASKYFAKPSIIFTGRSGFTKAAVPTCTADAPAMMNSNASSVEAMPPMPMTGFSMAYDTR